MFIAWPLLTLLTTARAGELKALDPAALAHALSEATADLAARVAPTAVYIHAERGPGVAAGLQQLMADYSLPAPVEQGFSTDASAGSGVIIEADGLILTNHHVIAGATDITVTLHDRRSFHATLVASDARTDVALLRIEGAGTLPAAQVGDSDAVRVGEMVMAVGHPFDFAFTVTTGVISARGRRGLIRQEIQDYLQTDASVNPGSSGGPLFDLDGRLIGINTAIYTGGGPARNAGISFAIPSNMAMRVAEELRRTGRVARAALGLTTKDAASTAARPRAGAEITRITPDGPAELAGLRRGDVVVEIEGEPVSGSEDLRGGVLARGADALLHLTVIRADQELRLEATTVDDRELGMADIVIPADAATWAGLTLGPVTDADLARFGISMPPREEAGVMVLAVDPEGPGAAAGIAPGDVLLEVQRKAVSSPAQLLEEVGSRRSALVTFWRGDGENYAAIGGLR